MPHPDDTPKRDPLARANDAGTEAVRMGLAPATMKAPAQGPETLDKDRVRRFDDARAVTINLLYTLNMIERRGQISTGDASDLANYLQEIASLVT